MIGHTDGVQSDIHRGLDTPMHADASPDLARGVEVLLPGVVAEGRGALVVERRRGLELPVAAAVTHVGERGGPRGGQHPAGDLPLQLGQAQRAQRHTAAYERHGREIDNGVKGLGGR